MSDTITFDHYEILRREDGSLFELGRGAMGVTYKAFDTSLRCNVALKVINSTYLNSEVARQRFVREARAAAKLRHRNVATVFHLGDENNNYFYAMEFIDGETVESLIKRQGPLDPVLALRITLQVTRALGAAQREGLVHRDIKPSNLMIVQEDDEMIVKVIDFGLARSIAPEGEDAATISMGGFVGTPHFASPEQLEEREIDVRSDIYSLGVTLWYMLSGRAPFAGSMAQIMSQHLSKPPPFDQFSSWPAQVVALMRPMLEKDPDKRPQTPQELRKLIEESLATLAGSPATPHETIAPESCETPTTTFAPAEEETQTIEVGGVLAKRYRLLADLGEGDTGRVFQAEELGFKKIVRLTIVNNDLIATPEAYTQLEQAVEKVRAAAHPNILKVYSLEALRGFSILVEEWVDGFTLIDLLRSRHELPADEASPILVQAAAAIDHTAAHDLKRLELALRKIQVHFPDAIDAAATRLLLDKPISQWPRFELKISALGISKHLTESATWAGGRTMVATPNAGVAPGLGDSSGVAGEYTYLLGEITYELLGGSRPPATNAAGAHLVKYTPLAALSEPGNEVLKRCLEADPAVGFGSAQGFVDALMVSEGLAAGTDVVTAPTPVAAPVRPKTVVPPPVKPPAPPPVTPEEGGGAPPPPAMMYPAKPAKPPGPPPAAKPKLPARRGLPKLLMGGAAVVALILVGVFAVSRIKGPPPVPTPESSNKEIPEALRTADRLMQDNKPAEAFATVVQVAAKFPDEKQPCVKLEEMAAHFRAQPDKVADSPALRKTLGDAAQFKIVTARTFLDELLRKDKLRSELAEAEQLEAASKWPEAIAKYVQIAKNYPESDARQRLEAIIKKLKDDPDKVRDKSDQLRQPLEDAYALGIPAAKALSDELGRTQMVVDAMKQARALEAVGNTAGAISALVKIAHDYPESPEPRTRLENITAQLRAKGKEIPDFDKLREPLAETAKLGVISAMMLLGEQLVDRDPKAAFGYFEEAAKKDHVPAMVQLGLLYAKGQGVELNQTTAVRWFIKAAESGDVSAKYMAGECYFMGKGVDADPEKAVNEFLDPAAAMGDSRALDLLGEACRKGLGTKRDLDRAADLYKKALELGNAHARAGLGVMYMNGPENAKGLPQDLKKGADQFRLGAEAGDRDCMFLFGLALEGGQGVKRDSKEAVRWIKKAADLAHPGAKKWLDDHGLR